MTGLFAPATRDGECVSWNCKAKITTGHLDFWDRKAEIEREAKGVMKQLQRDGGDWETAWMNHPLAKEYRALLKDAWAAKSLLESASRKR